MFRVVQLNNSFNNKTWSEVVENKKPPLIIKSKNSNQNSEVIKNYVFKKVDPTKINIGHLIGPS